MVPIPANEHFRLEAVRMIKSHNTDQSPALQELACLAAQIFDVPSAQISLIGETRQRALASAGGDIAEMSRSDAICAHTLLRAEALVVPDTALDDRFHQSSMVTGPPYTRFYAGVPLIVPEGFAIGTFSLMDRRPRHSFDGAAEERLKDLATAAMRELTGQLAGASSRQPTGEPHRTGRVPDDCQGREARFSAFADLAHDIVVGLDEIKQATDALEAAPPKPQSPNFRSLIANIQASAAYVHRIADRTLELTHLRGGAVELNEEVVDVAEVIDGIFARGRKLAHLHRVVLHPSVMRMQPKIYADQLFLERMITNLMTNAIVHSDRGGSAHCEVSSAANGELVIAMRNAGAFLSDKDIKRVLQPFQVVNSAKPARRPAGLGLPIVRRLIEMHGGSFDLTSSVEGDVEARLRFPAYRVLTWYSDNPAPAPNCPSTI